METSTVKPVNKLKHIIHLPSMDIEISLDDDCKNGHNDFSITGTIWTPGKPHIDKYWQGGGCCHEEILKRRPGLKIFVDLHLSDAKGAPLYAIENGFYHLKKTGKTVTMEYLRITEEEYNELLVCEDSLYFAFKLIQMGIPERWNEEAKKAIAMLEEMTGQKFEDDSVKQQFKTPSPEELQKVVLRMRDGYYTPAAIAQRETEKRSAARQKAIDSITADRDKAVKKTTDEFDVKLYILLAGLPLDNLIYYTHTNKAVFNWKDYDNKISREEFDAFINSLDASKLPEGILFEFGEKK